ncbi:stabilin-1 isoform X1 [Microcaecilia unicolor]|uniref:Stabilin-1 isoform X1 n=1 Tax=Microcaecilia unicolor TaxID=1415580 RepID=A0A6P7Y8T2_9AMPH|nr:stabilin-1 isoform X1 [Microcaecilia unicolor]
MWIPRIQLVIKISLLVVCFTSATEAQEGKVKIGRYSIKTTLNLTTECTTCAASTSVLCPRGSKKITQGIGSRDCSYTVNMGGETLVLSGCRHICQKEIMEFVCYEGFWGSACHECPSGYQKPCSGHGTCLDGITGNGACLCEEKYSGFACQECADENAYGLDCISVCDCQHGICSSGISGNGSCICQTGYTGPKCDQELPSCRALNCGDNARCIEREDGSATCECMPGYSHRGATCQPQNPCIPSPCSFLATCENLGQRQYRCTCKSGYQGDGKFCVPINPCMDNNGGCPENSTTCVYRAPGKASCTCQPGMTMKSSNISDGCSFLKLMYFDPCERRVKERSTIDPLPTCSCKEGEVGNGKSCYGNIMTEVLKLNTNGIQAKKLTNAVKIFEAGCALTLRKLGPFTVFVPVIRTLNVNETMAQHLCKLHIIPGQHLLNDLIKIKTLWTLAGEAVEFQNRDFSFQSAPEELYRIINSDLAASNGIIHIINKPRTKISMDMVGNKEISIGEILAKSDVFSRFETMLENCGLPAILNGPGSFTVFVPSNAAVDTLRDGRLIYLFTQGKNKLQELVKHHIYTTAAVTVDKLLTLPQISTMANEVVTINVTEDGRILLGHSGMPITGRDIVASNGIIHILDGVLIPSSIVPILPHRCDEVQHKVFMGACGHCDSIPPCPSDSIYTNITFSGCTYHLAEIFQVNQLGCARYCNQTTYKPGCCKGFFGPDCKPCPGGFSNPCFGRGTCSEGMQGNGSCICYKDFRGLACHICTNPNKHGDKCDEDCQCVHGVCDNRPGSGGVCRSDSCKAGFTGEFCDRRAEPCGPSTLSLYCHQHAVCESSGPSVRCSCANGYEGNGFSCQPIDLCRKPERGGCSINAVCTTTGPGTATCQCNEGWTGDGQACVPIDNCASEDRGGCHINADCIFVQPGQNTCTCKLGYAGDGVLCDPVNLCLENNGGCHDLAKCTPLVGGERTCVCPDGFQGNGMICYGDVLVELYSNSDFAGFYQWIKKSLFTIPEGSNVTVLVPSEAAVKNLSQEVEDFWLKPYTLPFLVRAHFLRGSFTIDKLKQYDGQELSSLNPRTKWEIRNNNGTVVIQNASVLIGDIPAINATIYIINKVLIPSLGDVPPPRPGLRQQLDLIPSFTSFKKSLQEYQLIDYLESSETKYTIFIPGNEAVWQYCNASNIQQLGNHIVKYHIIFGQKLTHSDLKDGMHEETMLGLSFRVVFYKRENQMYVNSIPLDGTFLETNNGMLIGVSQVLEIQKNRCDRQSTTVKKAKCNDCHKRISCPPGTTNKEISRRAIPDCTYLKRGKLLSGCTFSCVASSIVPSCCPGYFGEHCLMCPGKGGNCSGNGICKDGITGNGQCTCKEGFHGTACETCEAGRYRANCQSVCSCKNGKCNDGLLGDGKCICYKGWKGYNCDRNITNDLCNDTCSDYANCIAGSPELPSAPPTCLCVAGYTGNGTFCTEIDPCVDNNGGCSAHANCTKVAAGERTCSCHEGYTGDGIVCLEIDGCLENNGGCHRRAECTKTGPNMVACNCQTGFRGDGKEKCERIDLCRENNGGCSPLAICINLSPAIRKCVCKGDAVGDGIICIGTISQELAHDPAAAFFRTQLQVNKIKDLSDKRVYTVFVPHQDAVGNSTTFEEWKKKNLTENLILYHIVGCQEQLLISDLRNLKSVTSLAGDKINISVKEDGIYLNDKAKIISGDNLKTNGVIHFIDNILLPSDYQNRTILHSARQQNITEATKSYGYTIFSKLLEDANLLALVNDPIHKYFTMLWPTDEAFKSLPQERQKWLYHEEHRDKLAAYLKFHMIRQMKITAVNLPLSDEMRTMYGSTISIQCSKTNIGELMVGDQNARVLQRNMEFSNGIAHGIDQLLEPPNLGAHCDEFHTVETDSSCAHCLFPLPCPSGSVEQGTIKSCFYPNRRPLRFHSFLMYMDTSFNPLDFHGQTVLGCKKSCYSSKWVPKCCKNHYGSDCRVCPGGFEAPCSNRGACDDGISGSGDCSCNNGFDGTACELCVSGRYGPDCEKCKCTENGECNEGISGDGSCFCSTGWTGQYCETKLEKQPVCSPVCHGNASCRSENVCECHPYYEGDGRTCTVIDQCQEENGGCSRHANCAQLGINVFCTCFLDYEGDGHVCRPIDRCADGRNGGCSEHATCISIGPNSRRCECREGYVGNGVQCLEKAVPPVDRCLEMNGDCHPEAACLDLYFQEKTAGVFHLQSPKGKYKFTYDEAVAGCAAEGASLATLKQLAAAQQMGFHLCLVGWLDNGTAGYPTTYPNPSCGSNHVGIMDYRIRSNLSETWDAFCFRNQDVQCICRYGYVGDGNYCNGNLLEVLAISSNFSIFYSLLLDYANATEQGDEFLDFLSNETSYKTFFVPLDSGFKENVTLTWRDLEHHVSMTDTFLSSLNLTDGSVLPSRLGYNLSIADCTSVNCAGLPASRLVNDKVIIDWDILSFNGIIHAIEGPLTAPVEPVMNMVKHPQTVTGAVTAVVAIAFLLLAAIVMSCYYFKLRNRDFQFRYFQAQMDEGEVFAREDVNPPLVSIPNPVYGPNNSFSETFDEIFDNDNFSDTQRILEDD